MKIWKKIVFVLLVAGLATIQSCYYDNPPELEPLNPEDVSFSTHVLPILNSGCNTANCHDGTSEPNLLEDQAWTVLRGGYVNTTSPEESILYRSVEYLQGVDPMPPGGPQIPELDRQIILAWIQNGALND